MDLSQLRDMGLVSTSPLIRREITVRYHPLLPKSQWADPAVEERQQDSVEAKMEFWLRKMSAADEIMISEASRSGRDPLYTAIHRCVFTAKGTRVFPTEDDAIGLDLAMFEPLVTAINEVNGARLGAAKKSPPMTRPGASSPSPSADEASKNGESDSAQKSGTSGSPTEASGVR